MDAISLTGVSVRHPGTTVPALDRVNLRVKPGETVAVIGADGAGRTTLCRLLAGFIPHFYPADLTGTAQVLGMDPASESLARLCGRIGSVFENPFTQMSGIRFSVRHEIAFGLENRGVDPREMEDRVAGVMDRMGISHLANRFPMELSGGELQKVAMASILVLEPELLIMDSPTSQLDPVSANRLHQIIKDLPVTCIVTETTVDRAVTYADRLVLLHKGRIAADGDARTFLKTLSPDLHGVRAPVFHGLARDADGQGLWPSGRPYPIRFDEAVSGFSEALDKSGGEP